MTENKRLQNVIKNMQKEGLSQILVTSTASLYYLSSLYIEPHERMAALYLNDEGEACFFGNEIFGVTVPKGINHVIHTDNDDPILELSKIVKSGKLGIDKDWPSRFLISLMEKRNDIIPVHGSMPVDNARLFKDEAEIQALINASRINDLVMAKAIASIKDGIRENELASIINAAFLENGADCEGVQLVCFGKNGADPHHNAGSDVIKAGDSVIFDIFTPISHYWCDMTRTVFFKEVSEEQKTVYELVRRANEEAKKAVKPGVALKELDKIARDIISEGGYGEFFNHRLGHGLGLECHEPENVSMASEAIAMPGMVFSIEPGIYLADKFGVRIEDLVLVTENGCKVLNEHDRSLTIIK